MRAAALLTTQRKTDINSEVLRIQNYLQLLQFCRVRDKNGHNFSPDTTKVEIILFVNSLHNICRKIIGEMLSLLTNIWKPFTEKQEETWREKKAELEKKTGGLGISDTERQEIVKALDMGRGAWYACPNGHPYVIGDCHGAVMVSWKLFLCTVLQCVSRWGDVMSVEQP